MDTRTQAVQQTWSLAMRQIASLAGVREALPVLVTARPGQAMSRQVLIETGRDGQLHQFQYGTDDVCPVCVAALGRKHYRVSHALPKNSVFATGHDVLSEPSLASCRRYILRRISTHHGHCGFLLLLAGAPVGIATDSTGACSSRYVCLG